MANSLKKKTTPLPPSSETVETAPTSQTKLVAEKEPSLKMVDVVKDERFKKIVGITCLLLAAFLFVSFTSYLFTWQADQDKVQYIGIKILGIYTGKISNLMGVLGAYSSYMLIYKGFGVAAYCFCYLFFVLGYNLAAETRYFSIPRSLKYLTIVPLVLSITFHLVFMNSAFSWGGAVGELIVTWFIKLIGKVGLIGILCLTYGSYFIWKFNISFKAIDKKIIDPATIVEPNIDGPQSAAPTHQLEDEGSLPALSIQDRVIIANKLNTDINSMPLYIVPSTATDSPILDIKYVEKQQADEAANTAQAEVPAAPPINTPPLIEQPLAAPILLEIKPSVPNEAPIEVVNLAAIEADTVAPVVVVVEKSKSSYVFPPLDLLTLHGGEKIEFDAAELEVAKEQILSTLKNYDIEIQKIQATVGPTVTLFEIIPMPGIRISRIKNLEDDIALSLAALGIRIIAPIPGKGTIGIEVPNLTKKMVSMRTLLSSEKFAHSKFSLPIALGKKIDNENFIVDLASMPHLLMAGATGQGKSVGLNAILISLLYKKHPDQLKFVLIDPKKVELSVYKLIEKHFLAKLPDEDEAIITDTQKVVSTLNSLCILMDNRYDLLKEAACRNIKEYNEKIANHKLDPALGHAYMPFIVLVIDEFADLIMTAGKEVELPIARLAQLARAVGIHLIIATQRPSVNIITGTIKANFPARIAFKVSSKIDSRTILDVGGAEQLIGKGDMLISYNGELVRLQCAFVDTPEVDKVVQFIEKQPYAITSFMLPEYVDEKTMQEREIDTKERDKLFAEAARLLVSNQIGSTSLIQRRMQLGYNRAGRLMDQLYAAGIVGENKGSKAREVLVKSPQELEEILANLNP